MDTLRYETSATWIPPELRGKDVSNLRYIPDLTDGYKAAMLAIAESAELRDGILQFCPRRGANGWMQSERGIPRFLDVATSLGEPESRAASHVIDDYLTRELGGGVVIMPSWLIQEDVTGLVENAKTAGRLRETTYESMPTAVLGEVRGGLSLAIIKIADGDPETVEHEHVHNGSRLVICMSPEADLVLPGRTVKLTQWDAVWMGPWTLHSFQKGIFLALHTSEAGFDHPEAFLPFREEQAS